MNNRNFDDADNTTSLKLDKDGTDDGTKVTKFRRILRRLSKLRNDGETKERRQN